MCHGNAQNVSYHGTKRLLGKFCFFHIRKQVCSLNRSAGLEILWKELLWCLDYDKGLYAWPGADLFLIF
jgi:hypothetical protein